VIGALIIATAVAVGSPAGDSARGRALLDSALIALGGAQRIATTVWFVEGSGRENTTAEQQGLDPVHPTWRHHAERLAVDPLRLSIAWERRSPRNDYSLRWRRFIYTADSEGYIDWNRGTGSMQPGGSPESDRRAMARRVPHVLVLDAATRASSVVWSGVLPIHRIPCDMVTARLPDAGILTLWLARSSHTLVRAEYPSYLPGKGDVTVAWTWLDWTRDARFGWIPRGHTVDIDAVRFQEVSYQRYGADSVRAAALLTVSPAVRAAVTAPPPAREPVLPDTGVVAPGVHIAVINDLGVMFVEFRDFVVAVEAPQVHPGFEAIPAIRGSATVSVDFISLIHRTIPGKPIRYVIVSHHHSDHMGGIRAFATEGATIIVAPGHAAAARRTLDSPHTIAPDAWHGSSRDVTIETVASHRTITDGQRLLEIWNVGKNPHTDENLFVWLPAEALLFQGDLFYYVHGSAFPPSGRGTMNHFFALWLNEHHIAPRAIYGVHNNGAAGPQQVADALGRDGS
jgi:glyoxylase-like metal-dependent hydrolase (beta-lactamase superfamily II)